LLRKGHDEEGIDDAFKKVTAPASVAVVRERTGFLPAQSSASPSTKPGHSQPLDTSPKRSEHLSPAREAMTTSSITEASPIEGNMPERQ
jgi:hypothetical protein